jgi:hypothetical protein
MEERTKPTISPFCTHLASKKMTLIEGLPMTTSDVFDASENCWCEKTMQILGPDRAVSHPEDCKKGRTCFESPFESML